MTFLAQSARGPWLICLASACAGASGSARPASTGGAAPDGWAPLSWEDRHDTMTFAVLPNMARTFQRFHRTKDPEMTCRTCHGPDAEKVAYAMPHGLPALDPAHMPSLSSDPTEAKTARFMAEEVAPQMAEILGVPPYDPSTKKGFSCFNCHPARVGP
jgi:hypothetical protein